MITRRVGFAGLTLSLPRDWYDVTEDLNGSPPALAKGKEAFGVLQFSVAYYRAGVQPRIGVDDLRAFLVEFGVSRSLPLPERVSAHVEQVMCVWADFVSADEWIRTWYVSDGANVALVTYVSQCPEDLGVQAELAEAQAMIRSVTFHGADTSL